MKFSSIFIALAILICSKAFTQKGTISVSVNNLKNNNGACWFWLYNTAMGFPTDSSKAISCQKVTIVDKKARIEFLNLPGGEYAVASFHDENGDGKCNLNFFGIPKEGTGVSKNVFHSLSAPSFDDNKFALDNNGKVNIDIKLKY